MKTFVFEATQSPDYSGNWGKFLVGIPDTEWRWKSKVCPDSQLPLLRQLGWNNEFIWVMDLQTGEGCTVRHGGNARADLNRHRVWVCPLFEHWLAWVYKQDLAKIGEWPRLVYLPDAPFDLYGYRRAGVQA